MQQSLRMLRMIHVFMLVALFVYAFLPEWIKPHPSQLPNPIIFYAITVMTAVIVAIVFFVRRRMVLSAEPSVTTATPDPAALMRWRAGSIMCFALAEAIGLYGMVLRFIGFAFGQVIYFYIVAVVLMVYCRPRLPDSYSA